MMTADEFTQKFMEHISSDRPDIDPQTGDGSDMSSEDVRRQTKAYRDLLRSGIIQEITGTEHNR